MSSFSLKSSVLILFTIIFIAVFPHLRLLQFFPFAYVIPIILLVGVSLKTSKESFKDIGFNLKNINFKSFLIGGLVAIFAFTFLRTIFFPILEMLIDFKDVQVDLYTKLKGNTSFYIFILIMGALIGGVYEEIVFHGFIFTRLEKMINSKHRTIISFLITSIIFGFYHYQLGTADAINAFLMGAVYLGLFVRYKRNLWYSIFCHSVYNSIAITLLYLGYL